MASHPPVTRPSHGETAKTEPDNIGGHMGATNSLRVYCVFIPKNSRRMTGSALHSSHGPTGTSQYFGEPMVTIYMKPKDFEMVTISQPDPALAGPAPETGPGGFWEPPSSHSPR